MHMKNNQMNKLMCRVVREREQVQSLVQHEVTRQKQLESLRGSLAKKREKLGAVRGREEKRAEIVAERMGSVTFCQGTTFSLLLLFSFSFPLLSLFCNRTIRIYAPFHVSAHMFL